MPPRCTIKHPARMMAGVSLIEVLVSIIIVAVGLLGLAGLQARAVNAEFESYQRSQALILVSDMVERIRMNRTAMGSFKNISDSATGYGFVGTSGANAYSGIACAAPATRAETDICAWSSLLQGAAETSSGSSVGAMIGARGCIFYDATTEIAGVPDSGVLTVTVVWQGTQGTVASSVKCANGLYGSETQRRTVSMSFRLGRLS